MVKNKAITTGEFIYGIASLFFGFPTIEDTLSKENLSQTTGGLYFVLLVCFIIIFLLGIFALIDFVCRIFKTTFITELNNLKEYIEDNFF